MAQSNIYSINAVNADLSRVLNQSVLDFSYSGNVDS